jgi:hypothetical protein
VGILGVMSYMRVIVQQADPTRADVALALVDSMVIPAMSALPGLQHWTSGGDLSSGQVVSVSLWDTREHAEAGLAAVVPDAPARLAEVGLQMVQVYVCEINREINLAAAPA